MSLDYFMVHLLMSASDSCCVHSLSFAHLPPADMHEHTHTTHTISCLYSTGHLGVLNKHLWSTCQSGWQIYDWREVASIYLAVRGPPHGGSGGGAPVWLLESGLVLSSYDSLCGSSLMCFIQGLSPLATQDASGPSSARVSTHGHFNSDS